ncbi:VOC family protein [Nocardioides sp. URHA0020]|uniref:VOC family protein n=1 Tax=Nocardioides sp. URHA0020 TaxID=1380392 RepID=UPI00048FB6F9|nr:VOC family protein [Nocardioides sp. URHA0020]
MHLENLVIDALEPQRLGTFWEELLGTERLTDEPDIVETRLAIEDGPLLDLCFQQVPEPVSVRPRLHVGVTSQGSATRTDPEGNPYQEQAAYAGAGPLAALSLDSADPDRDADFWSWLTGWTPVAARTLRHPSRRGPVLELRSEAAPKGTTKNRMHLDVRLEPGEDADDVAASILERGGNRLRRPEWGELPWRSYVDPSGNEFCVLPASS